MSHSFIRIMLVEHDAERVAALREMLSAVPCARFEIESCGDVEIAAERLLAHPCDVVLLSVCSAGDDARAALRRLRGTGRCHAVVVLCESDPDPLGDTLLHDGAHDYLGRDGLDGRALAICLRHAADRWRSEEDLHRERDLLRTLIDNLPDHIYVKDVHSGFLLNNAAHLKFLGVSSQEQVAGKTDLDVFPHGVGDSFFAEEQEIIRTGEPLIGREERNVDAAGVEHWVSSTKVPWRDESGNILGIVGLSRDITRRKNYEQKLREQNTALEELARTRHQALEELKKAQSTLVQSEKLAGLGQMVAGVAHEMNNPLSFVGNNLAVAERDLSAICGLLEIYRQADPVIREHRPELMKQIADADERIDLQYTLGNLKDLLVRSKDGTARIRQIVRDLCDFARLDTGDLQEADINAGIRSTANIIAGAAKNNGIAVELDLGHLPRITCYPAKINQVVMNLLSNAIDACNTGGTVVVRACASPTGIELSVSDTGSGIDPKIQERIFDPFFTTKPPGKGTGLGLSISYGIVQNHGGDVRFESAPGQGTRFIVTLPLVCANSARS